MSLEYIFNFYCPDRAGIQAKITTMLEQHHANLIDVVSYSEPETKNFFARMVLSIPQEKFSLKPFQQSIKNLAIKLDLKWKLYPSQQKTKTLLAVSKEGHCLSDLLYRAKYRGLPIEVLGVVSNHVTFRRLVEGHDVPFYYLPVDDPSQKKKQEEKIQRVAEDLNVDLIVLARYMQIMSEEFSKKWQGRCINIHHSFLPSFKGANPFKRAYDRGVKIIGATAHYVTTDLDEGPIIAQDVEPIVYKETPDIMRNKSRDIESRVLGRAVRWHAEHRIFITRHKTIVFR